MRLMVYFLAVKWKEGSVPAADSKNLGRLRSIGLLITYFLLMALANFSSVFFCNFFSQASGSAYLSCNGFTPDLSSYSYSRFK